MKIGELFKAPRHARLRSLRPDHNQIGTLVRQRQHSVCIEFERYCLTICRPLSQPVKGFVRTLEWVSLADQVITFEEMCQEYSTRPGILDSIFNSKALDWIYRYAEDILGAQEQAAWNCKHAEDYRDMVIRGALNGFETGSGRTGDIDALVELEEYYRGEGHGGVSRVYVQIDLSPGRFLMLSRYNGHLGHGVRISYNHGLGRASTYLCIEDKDPEEGREFDVYDVDEYDEPTWKSSPWATDSTKPARHRYV